MEVTLEKYRNESNTIKNWFIKDSIGLRYLSSYTDANNWVHLLNEKSRFLYITRLEDEPVGFFDIELKEHVGHFAFYVAPQYRSKGIGKLILDKAFSLDTLKKVSRLEVGVEKENKRSIRILEQLYFEKVKEDLDGFLVYAKSI